MVLRGLGLLCIVGGWGLTSWVVGSGSALLCTRGVLKVASLVKFGVYII